MLRRVTPVLHPFSPSRRTFAAGMAAALVVPLGGMACGRGALGQSLQASPVTPVPNASDSDTASLAAATDTASHLKVAVYINAAGPYHFVVDTGAERSVIADNVAELLALPRGPNVTVDGIASRILVSTVAVKTLSFGPFSRTGLAMPVLPRTSLAADGYLGLDAIDGSRVTFDFHNKAIRIEQPHSTRERDSSDQTTHVQGHGSHGRLRVTDCLVDSVSATAFIDTGAEVSVGNPVLYEWMKARDRRLTEIGSMVLSGVTGGQLEGDVIPVGRIRMKDLVFSNGTLVIADAPDFANWHLRHYPALLIGMDYLRQFSAVTIDYRTKEVRFDLAEITPRPSPVISIEQQA